MTKHPKSSLYLSLAAPSLLPLLSFDDLCKLSPSCQRASKGFLGALCRILARKFEGGANGDRLGKEVWADVEGWLRGVEKVAGKVERGTGEEELERDLEMVEKAEVDGEGMWGEGKGMWDRYGVKEGEWVERREIRESKRVREEESDSDKEIMNYSQTLAKNAWN
jgi:hypothetical protein